MHGLLKSTRYDEIYELESNPVFRDHYILSLPPKEIYAFIVYIKERKVYHEKRTKAYTKLCKDSGKRLWSKEKEEEKSKEDLAWLKLYENLYDNPIFWTSLWEKKKKHLQESFACQDDIISYDEDYDHENDANEDGKDPLSGAVSMDEYFLRCLEACFKKRSIVHLIKNVGRLILNDERILNALRIRHNVDDFENLIECGLLNNVLFVDPIVAKPIDGDESMNIPIAQMQNVFYLFERMIKKERRESIRTLENPGSISSNFIPSGFPLKSRLYASAFVQSIKAYCHRRCNIKKDLIFVIKPWYEENVGDVQKSTPKTFYAYDLKHNIVFDNAALFFKYNVYTFKQNVDALGLGSMCFQDDESDIINECINFGFNCIMEYEVLEQLMMDGKRLIKDNMLGGEENGKETIQHVEGIKWSRLFNLENNELRSISIFPGVIKSDDDLLSCDPNRLYTLRSLFEIGLTQGSRFLYTLEYLLKVFIVDLNTNVLPTDEFLSSPESLQYFFVKKRFLTLLYTRLIDENLTHNCEIDNIDDLQSFLDGRAPFITYKTIELDQDQFTCYSHCFCDEYSFEEWLEDTSDNDESDSTDRPFKKIRASDIIQHQQQIKHQTTTTVSEWVSGDSDSGYDKSTEEAEYDERSNNDEEEEEEHMNVIVQPSKKRKRTVKISISNVHKDCFLFSESFYTFIRDISL